MKKLFIYLLIFAIFVPNFVEAAKKKKKRVPQNVQNVRPNMK